MVDTIVAAWANLFKGGMAARTTINADDHELMNQFHKPTDEKRMVVILPEATYDDWLAAPPERSSEFLVPFAAERLSSQA